MNTALPTPRSDALAEIGPVLPCRMAVYRRARELGRLAQIAAELATSGPGMDLFAALATLDRARALLDEGHGG